MRALTMLQLGRLLTTVMMLSAGQVLVKHGLSAKEGQVFGIASFLNPWVILGLLATAGSTWFYFSVLRELPLSVVYPFISLTYVVVLLASAALFHDRLSMNRLLGMALIVSGIFFVSR